MRQQFLRSSRRGSSLPQRRLPRLAVFSAPPSVEVCGTPPTFYVRMPTVIMGLKVGQFTGRHTGCKRLEVQRGESIWAPPICTLLPAPFPPISAKKHRLATVNTVALCRRCRVVSPRTIGGIQLSPPEWEDNRFWNDRAPSCCIRNCLSLAICGQRSSSAAFTRLCPFSGRTTQRLRLCFVFRTWSSFSFLDSYRLKQILKKTLTRCSNNVVLSLTFSQHRIRCCSGKNRRRARVNPFFGLNFFTEEVPPP